MNDERIAHRAAERSHAWDCFRQCYPFEALLAVYTSYHALYGFFFVKVLGLAWGWRGREGGDIAVSLDTLPTGQGGKGCYSSSSLKTRAKRYSVTKFDSQDIETAT